MLENLYFFCKSPEMAADPLSEILTFLGARCLVTGGFTAGGRWGLRFPAPGVIKFSAILRGRCWLVMEGHDTPVQVAAGDVLFFRGDAPFSLLSDLDMQPVEATRVLNPAGGQTGIGTGADFANLGGHVGTDRDGSDLLLSQLPRFIHIRGTAPEAVGLRWLLQELCAEGEQDRPGAELSMAQLAHLMFVRVLRAYLSEAEVEAVGWLRGLGDARIAAALRLLHADPGRSWSLPELARASGMSRSVFAARFRAVVGMPPLGYLTGWRMRLATRALEEGSQPVAAIAATLGYASESAFSTAFKRVVGVAPQRVRSAGRRQAA